MIFDAIQRARAECLIAYHEPDVLVLNGPAYDSFIADERIYRACLTQAGPLHFMGMKVEIRSDVTPRVVSARGHAFELQIAGAEK